MAEAIDEVGVVGGDDDGRAEPVQFFEQMHEAVSHGVIDVSRRFVGEQQTRPTDHRAGDRNALLLAARQGRRSGLHVVFQADPGEKFRDVLLDVAFPGLGYAERQRHVVEGGQVIE